MNDWNNASVITQVGTKGISKFELLQIIKKVYNKNILIKEFKANTEVNKILKSDFKIPTIEKQLNDLKKYAAKF